MTFECPVCGFIAENLTGLKKHFKAKHKYLSYCPICNKPVGNLSRHCRVKAEHCKAHAILFYLICTEKTRTEFKAKCRDLAYKCLMVV